MRYFVPKLQPTSEINPQTVFQEKLGGLPFGLQSDIYPTCKECGNPMTFIAQFAHHKERLDLGKDGRVLFIFVCDTVGENYSVCQSWDSELDANSCFVIEPETITTTKIQINLNVPQVNEFIIIGWTEFNDLISDDDVKYLEEINSFYEMRNYNRIDFTMFENISDKTNYSTRLGSVPSWIQFPESPKGSYKFVGQLDSKNGFEFGDLGIGYIFVENVKNIEQLPKAKFLWQCS